MLLQNTLNIPEIFFRLKEKHKFHLVINSALPIASATTTMLLVLNIVFYLHLFAMFASSYGKNDVNFQGGWFIFSFFLCVWFLNVVFESSGGDHTLLVRQGLRYGMILFIVSEIMFFFAFFWAFFHVSLSPSIAIGGVWPPESIQSLDVWGLPLVNTILLLSSGITITLAHHDIMKSTNYRYTKKFNRHLLATIVLGVIFLCCQAIEYKYGITFRWKESVYGSTFFATTGFHGFHVSLGTIFLLFCLIRSVITSAHAVGDFSFMGFLRQFFNLGFDNSRYVVSEEVQSLEDLSGKYGMTKEQHLGFEAAAWYWHFVDVVWIFLFMTIYWWGN